MSTYKGIDVSYWQGDIDWKKVKNAGIQFAVLREGYRNTIDKKFIQNVKGAQAQGIVVMVYHFIYTDNSTIKQNAESTVSNMKSAGLDPANTMIFSDLEYDTWVKNGETCTKEKCSQYTKEYLDELKRLGCGRLGIYMNIDYYRNYYSDELKNLYPVWLADYSGDADYSCIMQQTTSSGKVSGISGNVDMDVLFDNSYMSGNGGNSMGVTANDFVSTARAWLGCNEGDGSHKQIIDLYNKTLPLPRGYKVKYTDEWCDTFVSACAIKSGCVDLVGRECGCEKHVEIFKAKNIWIEDGTITPRTGDIILYNWDSNVQPNNGNSDHIGIVESVNNGMITVIEGNMSERVGRRTIRVGHGNIRGFARPRYATSSSGGSGSTGGGSSSGGNVQVGAIVKVRSGAKSYSGQSIASFVYNGQYRVDELKNDRAVLDKSGICTPFNVRDLIVVSGGSSSGGGSTGGTVQVGSVVKVNRGAKSYEGKSVASFVYDKTYRVDQLNGSRAVLDVKGLCTAFNTKDLTVVSGGGSSSQTIKVGSVVHIRNGAKSYEGQSIASWVYSKTYRVDELKGSRAVLDKNGLCTAFNVKDLYI